MALVSKPRSKSIVWTYFGLKADENGRPLNNVEAICRLCRKIVLAKGGNTTNLRSHLRRRHRADFFEPASSNTPTALFDSQGLDFSHDEFFDEVPILQAVSNQNYVPDAVLPPGEPWLHGGPSRAVLSLPSCLCLCGDMESGMSGSSIDDQKGELKVFAKCHLQQGVMFGPYVGELCRGQMPANLKYSWAIRDEASFIYVDAADENKSNWMRYVTYTSNEEEHNLFVFQFYRRIYYRVSQPISEGAELRVWIGRDYATLLGLGMGDNIKCEIGDKETALRLLQDIQLVTLPEPSSTSFWSDHSQSQSPMPIISDVTTMLHPDAASDPALISGSAFVSTSISSLPSPHQMEKYDFMPGTEKLLSSTSATHNSPWYFFGLEPDPSGRPLDRSTAVCKLCMEHVSCAVGVADLQIHLTTKHHIRLREGNKERSMTLGQQRCQLAMATSSLVTSLPMVSPADVTNAIANFLIVDLQPTALVEAEGFRKLMHTLLPTYKELPLPCQLESILKDYHAKGKMSIAQLLRSQTGRGEIEEFSDYTAPLESEHRRRRRALRNQGEVPHFVTLSVDVWLHNWQGSAERYLTLWAHYMDSSFSFKNLALATQRLTDSGATEHGLQALEAQVREMAQEWGISQPNLILLGGEGRNKTRLRSPKTKKGGELVGGVPHPNSTTFLERDSVSPEEPHTSEYSHPTEGLPSIPCFFSAVQDCIEEVMAQPIISKTLNQFQDVLSTLFLPPAQSKVSYQHHALNLLKELTKQEQAGLMSWAHSRPIWNKLYPLLNTLVKHKNLLCAIIKEVKDEGFPKDDASSESNSSGSHQGNSASSTSSMIISASRSDWKVLEDLCSVLKPLDVACRTLAKEAFPRLSLIKPILTGLLSRHLVSRPSDSSNVLKEVKRMMRRNLEHCYENPAVNKVLSIACSLDPQFHGLGFMDEKEQTTTFDWLKKEAVRIVKEDKRRSHAKKHSDRKRSPSPLSPESDSDSLRRSKRLKDSRPISFKETDDEEEESDVEEEVDEAEWVDPGSQGGLSGMEFLLGDLFCSAPRSKQSSVEETVDMEVSVFRADKGASLGVEPLQWWRTKAVQFPLLATVAQAYLAAPAVAGDAAQDFVREEAGATSRKRTNIPPESLDTILFLHHNQVPTAESRPTAAMKDDKNGGSSAC
ncbi:E3 SUMO-protein ligase ZBED1-like [Pholidichthys leucotaenia]